LCRLVRRLLERSADALAISFPFFTMLTMPALTSLT